MASDGNREGSDLGPEQAADADVINYQAASKYTGIGISTLYSLVARQQIPHIRLSGRLVLFRKSELDAWLREHAVSPK
jgi:excisionase family DNA binding protein